MIIVDNALKAREAEGRPIRVALIGAGFMSQGLANHIVNTMTGMRMVAVYNRKAQRAFDLCAYCGVKDVVAATTPGRGRSRHPRRQDGRHRRRLPAGPLQGSRCARGCDRFGRVRRARGSSRRSSTARTSSC